MDITVPVYNFSEMHYLPDETVTAAYKGALLYLTGKINNASFRGLAAGECLFLGASGSQRGPGEDWEITCKFAGSPNRTGITIGPITGIARKAGSIYGSATLTRRTRPATRRSNSPSQPTSRRSMRMAASVRWGLAKERAKSSGLHR